MTWDNRIKIFLSVVLLIVPVLLSARVNPIMIGSCGFRAQKTVKPAVGCGGNCPTGFTCHETSGKCYPLESAMPGDTCPTGFISVEIGESGIFICIPDCNDNNFVCGDDEDACPGNVEWHFVDFVCKCDNNPTLVDPQAANNFQAAMHGDTCKSKCFSGDVTFSVSPLVCNAHTGDDTIVVTINVPVDSCASITDLLNCNLTSGDNFLIELIAQFGFEALFCDDDSDGEIIVSFTRDPSKSTTIALFGAAPIVIPACDEASLSDPCSCTDPLNVYNADGSVKFFHDKFTFIGTVGENINLTVNAGTMGVFTDAAGTMVLATDATFGMITAAGTFEKDFYRLPMPNGVVDISFIVGAAPSEDFMSTCDISTNGCPKIPTTSEWGLISLMLSLMIIGIVGLYTLRVGVKS